MFQGITVRAEALTEGLVELCFDRQGESINKLDARAVEELKTALDIIAAERAVRGVLISSARKPSSSARTSTNSGIGSRGPRQR